MKQLGLALHNYHDAHKQFPPGIVSNSGGNYCASESAAGSSIASSACSGITLILPFLEERALYQAYNMRLSCAHVANSTSATGVVKTLVCPSNPRAAEDKIVAAFYPTDVGVTDYVFNAGGAALLSTVNPYQVNSNATVLQPWGPYRLAAGAFNINSNVNFRTMRDGSSQTFLMGEGGGGGQLAAGTDASGTNVAVAAIPVKASTTSAVDNAWSQGYIGTSGVGGYGSVFAVTCDQCSYDSTPNLVFPNNNANDQLAVIKVNEGRLKFARVTTYAASLKDASPSSGTSSAQGTFATNSVSGFRSYHAGMCHFLFGDGSVRPVSENVDGRVYVGSSTCQGREVIDTTQ